MSLWDLQERTGFCRLTAPYNLTPRPSTSSAIRSVPALTVCARNGATRITCKSYPLFQQGAPGSIHSREPAKQRLQPLHRIQKLARQIKGSNFSKSSFCA